ncbi:AbgT family transporter [Saccharopolyspora hattusasensis]|uniref:AbgT family transporter n=1 Tax=Saccharopolyspora hattusasensis TaxID=1128679 RepID=UPI003D95FBDA
MPGGHGRTLPRGSGPVELKLGVSAGVAPARQSIVSPAACRRLPFVPPEALLDAGIGTVMSFAIPLSFAILLCWGALFVIWYLTGVPLGPGATSTEQRGAGCRPTGKCVCERQVAHFVAGFSRSAHSRALSACFVATQQSLSDGFTCDSVRGGPLAVCTWACTACSRVRKSIWPVCCNPPTLAQSTTRLIRCSFGPYGPAAAGFRSSAFSTPDISISVIGTSPRIGGW